MEIPKEISRLVEGKSYLITGGAGFIGSNLSEALLNMGASVFVLDSLVTGLESNVERLSKHEKFTFIQGDICHVSDDQSVLNQVDAISHQAALGSVPRSIALPLNTHAANTTGFLTILHEAFQAGVKRFVYASSSSVYGDTKVTPKVEGIEGNPLSPYAVTKKLDEQYALVYHQLHQMETIGLRYFNVFGLHQNPNGVYAAAIPKFLDKMLEGGEIVINGNGTQTRDFTYVKNAIYANVLALTSTNEKAFGEVFNVACGDSFSLNTVIQTLENGLKKLQVEPKHSLSFGPPRAGDLPESLANISKIRNILQYEPLYTFSEGIDEFLKSKV